MIDLHLAWRSLPDAVLKLDPREMMDEIDRLESEAGLRPRP